jgi:hypothetical protein
VRRFRRHFDLIRQIRFKDVNKELFKGKNEAIIIDGINSSNGLVNIIFNKDGLGNYDIAGIKSFRQYKSKPIALNIQNYKIENFRFRYFDENSKNKISN